MEVEFWIDTNDYVKLMSVLGTILYNHSRDITKRCYYVSNCFVDDEEKLNTIDEAYENFEKRFVEIPSRFRDEFEHAVQNINMEG